MSTNNPYAFDSSSPFGAPMQGSADDALNRSIQALSDTRPWVRLMGVLTAIGAVLMALAGCVALPAMANGGGAGAAIGAIILVVYLGIAIIYGFAAKFLLGYGSAITRAETTRSINDIAEALVLQKSFWKLVGISTAIIIVLYLVFIVLAVVGGFALQGL